MAGKKGRKKPGQNNTNNKTYSNKYKKKVAQQLHSSHVTEQEPPQPVIESPEIAPGQDNPSRSGAQTQQQLRAKFALDEVKAILDELKEESKKKEFKSHASSLPAMILMNGLGQAAAFYLSKGGVHKQLYDLLSDWLTRTGQPYADQKADPLALMTGITTGDMHSYRIAQAEALMLLDWVKKFANAYVRQD